MTDSSAEDELFPSQEENYSERTKACFDQCRNTFESWRGTTPYSDDLVVNFVHVYLKGSGKTKKDLGKIVLPPHKASSTRTMFSHLRRYLNEYVHFKLSDDRRDKIFKYLDKKDNKEPVKQAKVFTAKEIETLFSIETKTVPQIRDKLIFALVICTGVFSRSGVASQ